VDAGTFEERSSNLGSFEVSIERGEGVVVIAPVGELDIATTPRLDEALRKHEAADCLILDLRGLTFMDVSGLRVIAAANDRSRSNGCRLTLLRGERAVHRVFEMLDLEQEFDFAIDGAPAPPSG
jgi:anti-sigma B factor antagonist